MEVLLLLVFSGHQEQTFELFQALDCVHIISFIIVLKLVVDQVQDLSFLSVCRSDLSDLPEACGEGDEEWKTHNLMVIYGHITHERYQLLVEAYCFTLNLLQIVILDI